MFPSVTFCSSQLPVFIVGALCSLPSAPNYPSGTVGTCLGVAELRGPRVPPRPTTFICFSFIYPLYYPQLGVTRQQWHSVTLSDCHHCIVCAGISQKLFGETCVSVSCSLSGRLWFSHSLPEREPIIISVVHLPLYTNFTTQVLWK
jgi:hypothetical protein